MVKRDYDFAGWVTKNDIRCSDGVTIKHDAFRDNDGKTVPLVWNHDYNSPTNVLGHVLLENKPTGVYGYGYFNDTEDGQSAKELVKHGDISSMSIGARKLKRAGSDIVHGHIYEVSLVMAGANPGAKIESVVNHSEDGETEEKGIIQTGNLIHSRDDVPDLLEHKEGGTKVAETKDQEKTIGDVIDGMTDEQKDAVHALLGMVADQNDDDSDDDKGDGETVKQNVFAGKTGNQEEILKHSLNDILKHAVASKASSLKEVLDSYKAESQDDSLKHGINSIEMLFPEVEKSTNGNEPLIYKDPNTAYKEILAAVNKTPFARIRTTVADLTEEEARAKGYIKGNFKKEEFFSLIRRKTGPTTIYKKQKLDRDDIIDIEDFDVVRFLNKEMRMMLEEEIARAIIVGDGREVTDEDKVDEESIRPIITDHEFFTIQEQFSGPDTFIETAIRAKAAYRGSGSPVMYIDPELLADVKLLKKTDGSYVFGDIPSTAAVAAKIGVSSIVETSFMSGHGAVIVNMKDYSLGAAKGGQITNFDDFDIDFNQYKYLIETRLSGALTMPKSAIHLSTAVVTGADDTAGGMTYGKRQADKTTPEEPTV